MENGLRVFRRREKPCACLLLLCLGGIQTVASMDKTFPADAVINVTLPPYNARPDDGKDDTPALQRAISDQVDTGRFLYLPNGVYEISDSLVAKDAKGFWRAHLTLQGQSRDKAILKLKSQAPGFQDPARPKALLMTGSHWQEGDNPQGGGNKAFRNNLFDLTLDTGSGNPGAMAVEYAVSNFGSIRNVSIRSGDGSGVAGIAMKRRIPGPGLIKNVSVEGFEVGIDVGDIQYGITLEHVQLRNQKTAALRSEKNPLHVRGLTSVNRVPAVVVTGIEGALTLLDSSLTGGSSGYPAVDCSGTLLMRNVRTEGYRPAAARSRGTDVPGVLFQEWMDGAVLGDPSRRGALLPVEETPEFWNDDPLDWIGVGARKEGEPDDTAAIQRAVDSGKRTVYFPTGRTYFLSDTVVIRGNVRQLLGMGSEISLGAAKEPFSNHDKPRPLFRLDRTVSKVVFLENLFFNAQYPEEILFENNTPSDVVIKHSGGWVGGQGSRRSYRNTERGTGKLFVEDVFLPGWEFSNQQVWARQFNPENYDADGGLPQVINRGGKLWILGFKTEGPAPFIASENEAVTELLGGYNYISATERDPVPPASVPYLVSNSRVSLTFVAENFRETDYAVYIRETQGDKTREWKPVELPPRNGRAGDKSFGVSLYQSSSRTD